MKILCISDTHGKHNQIPSRFIDNSDGSIDMCIHSGDVSSRGHEYEIIQFINWYSNLPFKYKIFIAGNHDFYFEETSEEEIKELLSDFPEIIYLNDSGVEIEGLKIWGSPVQPWFYNWAFNRTSETIGAHWDKIPLDTNILITHGGPKGVGCLNMTRDGKDVGCPQLFNKLSEIKNLSLFIQGHIHEGYGRFDVDGGPTLVNASVLDLQYRMSNNPIIVEI
jgi:Icc-related predicted phosphoesterase